MGTVRPALLSILIATSCVGGTLTPTATPAATASRTAAPSAAAASPSPSASPTPSPSPTGSATAEPAPTYPAPSADPAAGIGPIRSVVSIAASADASRVVGVLATAGSGAQSVDVLAIQTGQRTRVAHARAGRIQGLSLRGGTLVYFDVARGSDGAETLGVWRVDLTVVSPAPVRLDEFPMTFAVAGGDSANPWPWPRTNGRDVVWLRTRGAPGAHTYELVMGTGIGPGRVIHSGALMPFYWLDELGRVAIVTSTDREATLAVHDADRLREIARRPAGESGVPSWVHGKIAWFDSAFSVRPASRADLIDPATGASTPFAPPAGCHLLFPTTRRHILVSCFGGLTAAHDVVTGKVTPLAPIVLATPDGLLMRSTAELAAGENAWLHAAVLPP